MLEGLAHNQFCKLHTTSLEEMAQNLISHLTTQRLPCLCV